VVTRLHNLVCYSLEECYPCFGNYCIMLTHVLGRTCEKQILDTGSLDKRMTPEVSTSTVLLV